MRSKFLKWLCLVAFLYPHLLSGQSIPGKVDIKAEKQVLRPGETTKIKINNFRTKNNRQYVPDTNVFVGDRITDKNPAVLVIYFTNSWLINEMRRFPPPDIGENATSV